MAQVLSYRQAVLFTALGFFLRIIQFSKGLRVDQTLATLALLYLACLIVSKGGLGKTNGFSQMFADTFKRVYIASHYNVFAFMFFP